MNNQWNLTGNTVRNASGFAIADLVFGTDEQRAQHGALITEAPAMVEALRAIAAYETERPAGAELDYISAGQMAAIAAAILSRIEGATA